MPDHGLPARGFRGEGVESRHASSIIPSIRTRELSDDQLDSILSAA